uniref:G protein-coupled receptor n=1 Tax=Acrobeloides nanus TaxID=290746 RepID=A0A914EE40_9BILA
MGRNFGYPVISSMGCNGCEELKNYRCALPVNDLPESRNYRMPIGLNKVDDTYINGIRLRHLITFVINTFAMILVTYLIIGKSNKEMKEYRWFLLNIAALAPTICLMCPYVFMMIAVAFSIPNVIDTTTALFLISSLHSTLNTLMMVLTIRSYRDAVIRTLTCGRLQKHSVVNIPGPAKKH